MISILRSPASTAYDDSKRAQGNRHTRAVLALARRRVNVLLAMLPDPPFLQRTTALTRSRRMTNRIENRVLTTPQPLTACWSSFGPWDGLRRLLTLDRLQTHPGRWEDRLVIG
jgi:hypothetical protein